MGSLANQRRVMNPLCVPKSIPMANKPIVSRHHNTEQEPESSGMATVLEFGSGIGEE